MGNPTAVKLGPGLLYIAPVGTAEPTSLTGAWGAGWTQLGYTDEGHEFTHEQTIEPVEVAEEFYPIRHAVTSIAARVAAALAEMTAKNLKYALNGGTISAPSGGYVTFEPPAPNAIVRVMLGWDADDSQERWVFRQVINTAAVAIPRRKAPDKTVIPVEFSLEKPAGLQPFKAFFAEAVA